MVVHFAPSCKPDAALPGTRQQQKVLGSLALLVGAM
jgi:hypothetical protein